MFLNPLMLAGIGGAVVPLVLHLLSRARYRSVDWGAMMFLGGGDVRQRRTTKLKQWILLLIRMSIVAALAVGLARPAVDARLGGLAGNGRATAVIVLDDSASMNCLENGRTRLDQAREVVLQILAAMTRGDQVSLIPTGTPQTQAERAPTSDLQSVAARISSVRAGAGEADLAGSLLRAADVLDRYERVNREIYIVTDRQAVSWRRINDTFRRSWRNRWAGGASPRITVFTVGGETSDNVAVESVDLPNPPIIKDQPTDVEVRVRNYGAVPRNDLPVTLSLGRRVLAEMHVTLAADSSTIARATVRFPDAGSRVITAAVKSSGQTSDDRLDRAIDVSDPVNVLILDGDGSQTDQDNVAPYRKTAELLRLALSPFATTHRAGSDPAVVTVLPAETWTISDLDPFDVVITANVQRFTAEQARDLEQFAYGGRGILIVPGSFTQPAAYNDELFRGGVGIMPASFSPVNPGDGAAATSLRQADVNHPIFQFLKGPPGEGPSGAETIDVPVFRYLPAVSRASAAQVLASYADGNPFLIEGSAGRGRVLLVTTSLDAGWSLLPATSLYLPMVQSAVRYLGRTGSADRNLLPGQPIVAAVDEPVDERSASIRLPGGQTEPIVATRFEGRTDMRFIRTEDAGVYQLRYRAEGKDRTLHYVVSSPQAESDLTPMTRQQWDALAENLGIERSDPVQTPVVAAVARDRAGRELWAVLIGGVLVLAVLELWLGRLWSSDV